MRASKSEKQGSLEKRQKMTPYLYLLPVLVILLVLVVICTRTEKGRKIGLAFLSKFKFFRDCT